MATSTVELHTLTSASLGPDDSITLYENPYTALEKLQDASKDKEIESSGDVNGVDWRKYEPPAALRKAPTIKSQILLDIIFSSIENVKSRVEEEERLLKEAVIVPTKDSPAESSSSNINTRRTVASSTTSDVMLSACNDLVTKAEKRRKFGLRNIFQRSPEGGETSAAGRSREALRHKLETKILSFDAKSTDPKTQEAITVLRKFKLLKTVDLDELV